MKNDKIKNKLLIYSILLFFLISSINGQQSRCLFMITESEFFNFNKLKSGIGENKYINIFIIINNII
jgi:hypothetical protein